MSIHDVAETTPATKDAQVIADMAAAVLASIARIHADGLVAVSTIAENPVPVRLELPPVAEEPVAEEPVAEPIDAAAEPIEAAAELIEDDEPAEFDAELAIELDETEAEQAIEIDDEPVVRIAEPVWIAPQPRGRHFSEAVTDQLPAQHAA